MDKYFKKAKDASYPGFEEAKKLESAGKPTLDNATTGILLSRPMAIRQAIANGYKTAPKQPIITPAVAARHQQERTQQRRKRDDYDNSSSDEEMS
ncbi:hypothetical protein HDU98_001054 [Podochytrium sp. JEL0797]|nr:hypothetical protein HDU98_001054 [Podochytrium sp. JEL0797]